MPLPTNIDWNGVQENQGEYERLEPGGYVAHIVRVTDVSDQSGDYLNVEFDIHEGPFAGFYKRLYERFQNWNGRFRLYYNTPRGGESFGRVKAFKTAIEKSNGISLRQFDQRTLEKIGNRRLLIGVLMGYDKREHKYLNVYQVRDVGVIRNNEYEIPDEWRIHADKSAPAAGAGYGGYGGASSSYGYGGNGYGAAPPPPASGETADDDGDLPFD